MKQRRYLVVPFLVVLAFSRLADAQEKTPTPKSVPRESLRYDGKAFEYWRKKCQDELTSELKPERKIEGIRAMRAFGTNGYGAEAAAVIVDLVRTCHEEDVSWGWDSSAGLSPEQLVFFDAIAAMKRIGTPGVSVLMARTDHGNIRVLARDLLARTYAIPFPPNVVPRLVQLAMSADEAERDLALDVLYFQMVYRHRELSKPLANELKKSKVEEKFYQTRFRNMRYGRDLNFASSENLFQRMAPHSPNLKRLLVVELRQLKNAREKDVAEEKKSFKPRFAPYPGGESETWETHLPTFYSPSRRASVAIVNVLASMGPAARDALPELREALQDPYVELQTAAKKAIEQIEGKRP